MATKIDDQTAQPRRGFKEICQRIQKIEHDLNSKNKKKDQFSIEDFSSSVSLSLSYDNLSDLEKFNSQSDNQENSESISSSSDNDDYLLLDKKHKKHYSQKTLSYFSKTYSSKDDSTIQTNQKNKEKNKNNQHYHYCYKNRCDDFSADTATSDFDDLFSYSSDSYSE